METVARSIRKIAENAMEFDLSDVWKSWLFQISKPLEIFFCIDAVKNALKDEGYLCKSMEMKERM